MSRFVVIFLHSVCFFLKDFAWVSDRNCYFGRLYFRHPDALKPGDYELHIGLDRHEVVIPFRLEDKGK